MAGKDGRIKLDQNAYIDKLEKLEIENDEYNRKLTNKEKKLGEFTLLS